MLSLPNLMTFLDLRTILAVGGFVAYAAAAAMAIQAFKAQTFRAALWAATTGLVFGATSLICGSLSNNEPASFVFLLARVFGTLGFLGGMCALMLMFRRTFPKAVVAAIAATSMLGFCVFSEGSSLLNWSSFCQTFIAAMTVALVFASSDPLTPKLRRLAIFLCLLVALGPMPHLYTSVVNYFDLALPLFDQASAYRFRIFLNVTVLVLGYSCMNALAQARDALRLRDSIDYDMLTGAHSRRYLFDADEKNLRRERVSNKHSTTVLLLDIDHFKQVNDQWGHQVGDAVLKHCVTQIRDVIRQSDAVIARYGGEEFCIVVPQISYNSAAVLAERVREKIQSNPYVFESIRVAFTVSIGISHRSQYTPLDELIRIADQFLYAAKRGGRNRVSYQSAAMVSA
jgi:diguanylate cyclase (GGDEF)-like protein